jgi:outer membrane protein TolC
MRSSLLSSGLLIAAAVTCTQVARAQTNAAPPAAGAPVAPTTTDVAPMEPASTTPMAVPEDLTRAHAGGITAEQVGQRAMETSFAAKQSLETLHAAQARMDAAWAQFLPRLSGAAKYTHLSGFTPPSIGSGNIVATNAPAGVIPFPPAAGVGFYSATFSFPLVLNNYLLQATLTIPISDYFLRINQGYTAASRSEEAARYDLGAARAGAFTNAKVAYYTWMQMRGAVVVAVQALNDQRVHLNDAKNQFTVGNASKADVLRAETNVASAELTVVTAENQADLAETQMRIAIHAPDDRRLVPGEGLDGTQEPFQGNLKSMVDEGLASRFEVKSIVKNAESARKTATVQKAGRYPVVSAFGDGIYGNPNPRVFPATQTWFPTWDVGVQALWAPNDVLTANGNAADYEARASALEAQAQVTREGVEVEITQDWQALKQAEFALGSTRRELASAEEAYRVARELFTNGRGTSTTLTDAEGELTRARIDALNAVVNARIARVRLDHAVGRDLRGIAVQP